MVSGSRSTAPLCIEASGMATGSMVARIIVTLFAAAFGLVLILAPAARAGTPPPSEAADHMRLADIGSD